MLRYVLFVIVVLVQAVNTSAALVFVGTTTRQLLGNQASSIVATIAKKMRIDSLF